MEAEISRPPRPYHAPLAMAVAIVLAAGALIYQSDVRARRPPAFSQGGAFNEPDLRSKSGLAEPSPTPSPLPAGASTGALHSAAVLTAPTPGTVVSTTTVTQPFPPFGRYVYAVSGTEGARPFGSRPYPSEMTMTVHRTNEPGAPPLRTDEAIFDLFFSQQHEEREIVAFDRNGVFFTYEAGSITFGPVTRTSEATYDPPMLEVPLPLKVGAVIQGQSRAVAPDGSSPRTEDWTVRVLREEPIRVLDRTLEAWVVQVHRQSVQGSSETVDRTRTYWYYPDAHIWVKWTEDFTGSQPLGPGRFTYESHYTATLESFQPM